MGQADIGQFAGTVSPGLEQTDCIRPLMHWQTHFACTSVEQISPKPRTAIFRNCLIWPIAPYWVTARPSLKKAGAVIPNAPSQRATMTGAPLNVP